VAFLTGSGQSYYIYKNGYVYLTTGNPNVDFIGTYAKKDGDVYEITNMAGEIFKVEFSIFGMTSIDGIRPGEFHIRAPYYRLFAHKPTFLPSDDFIKKQRAINANK